MHIMLLSESVSYGAFDTLSSLYTLGNTSVMKCVPKTQFMGTNDTAKSMKNRAGPNLGSLYQFPLPLATMCHILQALFSYEDTQ